MNHRLSRRTSWWTGTLLALLAIGASACGGGAASAPPTGGAQPTTAAKSAPATAAPAAPKPQATAPAQAASPAASGKTLFIGGIPDQAPATLNRAFDGFANYLSAKSGLTVKYAPAQDYAAIVAAFKRGEVHLVWFGGLTGVQARSQVPNARAVAMRPIDAQFHSKFIAGSNVKAQTLTDLKGLTFTFGSESSTSGHLMPRHFMLQAGVDPDKDLKGKPNFSGAHDKTYKLVETGAFEAGVLNEAVWNKAVKDGAVDTTKVREFFTTPEYFDYNWTVHPDVDALYGPGSAGKLTAALLNMKAEDGPEAKEALELFATDMFVETKNENYDAIRQVAEQLGMVR